MVGRNNVVALVVVAVYFCSPGVILLGLGLLCMFPLLSLMVLGLLFLPAE